MFPEEKQLLSLLHDAVRRHYGSIGEIERSLGREAGYLSKLVRGERPLSAHALFAVLRALGEPIDSFFRPLGGCDVLTGLDALPPGPQKGDDDIPRLRKHSRALLSKPHPQESQLSEELANLKPLTRKEPNTAARVAHAYACEARTPTDFGRAVALYVAARRVMSWLEPAVQALIIALPLARRGASSTQTKLLLEASAVLAAHGEYRKARHTAAEAATLSVRHGEYEAFGRALANQAAFYCIEGDHVQSVAHIKHALPHLAADDVLTRVTAYQIFGFRALDDNNIATAWEWADKAHALVPQGATYDHATLVHWRAAIANKAGDLPTAEGLYRRSRDLVRDLNVYDLAVRTLELVRVLMQLGRGSEAVAEARHIIAITKPLRGHRLVDATTIKLSIAAHRGFKHDDREIGRLIAETMVALTKARARQ